MLPLYYARSGTIWRQPPDGSEPQAIPPERAAEWRDGHRRMSANSTSAALADQLDEAIRQARAQQQSQERAA